MPLYKFVCKECSLKFESITSFEKSDDVKCPSCKAESERLFPDRVSVVTSALDPKRDTVYSPKEIDKVVGSDADKKWEAVENRKAKRVAQQTQEFGFDKKYHEAYKKRRDARRSQEGLVEVELPRDPDGKITPMKHLGSKEEREIRDTFCKAIADYKEEQRAKGESTSLVGKNTFVVKD